MTTDIRITELITRWESLFQEGRPVSIDELCRDCPELAADLRRHVESRISGAGSVHETLAERATASSTPSVEGDPPPTQIGGLYPHVPGYEFVGELGRGGMGVVYKARQTSLNRLVAIKTIITGAHAGSRERARFYAEAEAVARLSHPNIVQIYDIGECAGVPYFSMELVEGASLHRRLNGQPIDPITAAMLIETVALAIQYAHQRGIVHRDLKPANILMAGDEQTPLVQCMPKLTDFGLARQLEEDVRLTQTGVVLGTPCYMSPEQVENPSAEIQPTVDVYGLGALLYEMLTGRPPFSGTTNFDTMRQVVSEAPVRPSLVVPSVPRGLERICLKCLEKNPARRYANAQDLADDLALFVENERPTVDAQRASGTHRRGNRRLGAPPIRATAARRNWQTLGLVALSALVVVMGTIGFFHRRAEWQREATGEPTAAALPAPTNAPIKVGILHSLTGTMRISEASVVDAAQLAIDELNEQGGLLGRKIEAIVRDGRSDPTTFAVEAEKLIGEDHVCAIFGCWTSASRKTVLPIVEENNNLLVYPVEFEGLEQSPNVLYVGPAPNQQIIPAVKWFFAFADRRKFFLVGSDYVFPRVANEIIKDELKKMSEAQVVGEAYLPLGSSDVAAVVQQIKDSGADVILNTINGDSNVAFFRALRTAGLKPEDVPVVSFSIGEPELRSMRPADVIGDYAARNYFQSTDQPENNAFLRRFWTRYGQQRPISDAMESAYVGVHLWAKAVQAAGTNDVNAVREKLRGQQYLGPGGRVYVDPVLLNTHRVSRIGRVEADGQFEVVWSSGSPLAPEIYPKTRSREAWNEFLASLYRQWGNSWSGPTTD